MKKLYNIFLIMILLTIIVGLFTCSYGIDTSKYEPGQITDSKVVTDKAKPVIKMLLNIGLIVGSVGIALLGLRYILGSAQEKAEYKETMFPFIFGAIFTFAVFSVLRLIAGLF